jgi:hypothetical protein
MNINYSKELSSHERAKLALYHSFGTDLTVPDVVATARFGSTIMCPHRESFKPDMNARCPEIPSSSAIQGYCSTTITYLKALQTQVTRLGMDLEGYRECNPRTDITKPKYNTAIWWFSNEESIIQFRQGTRKLHDEFRDGYCCNQEIANCTGCFKKPIET